jgi:hypothetical protein
MFMDAIACCLMPFLGHLPLQEGKKSESARDPRGLRNSNIGIGETRTCRTDGGRSGEFQGH